MTRGLLRKKMIPDLRKSRLRKHLHKKPEPSLKRSRTRAGKLTMRVIKNRIKKITKNNNRIMKNI